MSLTYDANSDLTQRPIGNMKDLLEDLSFRGLKCNAVLDVGANLSEWSKMAKKIFHEAKFYMIEPLAEMEQYLKKFCYDFPGSKYFLNGAGSNEEKLYLTIFGDDLANLAGANFMVKEDTELKSQNKQREIQIITIDSLLEKQEIEMPQLVKLDIQGFELEALKGASKLFGESEVFILEASLFEFTEGMPILSDVILFMAERNYVIYDFPGFLRRPYDGALGQVDVCFVKKGGFLRKLNLWFKTE